MLNKNTSRCGHAFLGKILLENFQSKFFCPIQCPEGFFCRAVSRDFNPLLRFHVLFASLLSDKRRCWAMWMGAFDLTHVSCPLHCAQHLTGRFVLKFSVLWWVLVMWRREIFSQKSVALVTPCPCNDVGRVAWAASVLV